MAQEHELWQWFLGHVAEKMDPKAGWSDDPSDEFGDRITRYWLQTHGLPHNSDDARAMVEFVMLAIIHAEELGALVTPKPGQN